MVYNFVGRKTGSEASVNEELTRELHKPVIQKCKKKESVCEF